MANTGNIIVTEQDINPNSPTYNQTRTRTYEDETRCPPGGDFKLRYVDRNNTRRTLYCNGETVLSESVDVVSGTVGGCVTEIGEQWKYQDSYIRSITFSPSVTYIGRGALNMCQNLETVNLAEGLVTIANYAFAGCHSLSAISIPSTVTSIGSNAFRGCISLTSIIVYATTPPGVSNADAFYDTNDCPIYVPFESVETYKTTVVWRVYASRIQANPFD